MVGFSIGLTLYHTICTAGLVLSRIRIRVRFSFIGVNLHKFITFRVSRRRREIYCGHARLCVCLSVCLSVRGRMPTLLYGPGCYSRSGRGCPLVVH